MATQWLRLWHEMPTDPKFRTVARHSKQPVALVLAVYLHMLVNASQADPRGTLFRWCDEDVASALDVDEEQVSAVRKAMQSRVLDGDTLMGWERRQPEREESGARGGKTSTERSRERRERLKREKEGAGTPAGNGMQRNATECNAPDTDQDKDTDKKKSGSDGEVIGTSPLPPPPDMPDYAKAPDTSRAAAMADLVSQLEAARGIEIVVSEFDRAIAAWDDAGLTDQQIRQAHGLAVADRTKREGPGKGVNPGFINVFMQKLLSGELKPIDLPDSPSTDRPWFLDDRKLKERADELGYRPPKGFDAFPAQWRVDFLSRHKLVAKDVFIAECKKHGVEIC